MTEYSARVSRLASFAEVVPAREGLESRRAPLNIDHLGARRACAEFSPPEIPALWDLRQVFGAWATTEEFVATVHDEIVDADRGDGSPVSYDGAAVDLALRGAGLDALPAPIEIGSTEQAEMPPLWSGYVDDPINASNGNMVHPEHDIAFPAIAAALNITRTWNSLFADRAGAFGAGWSSVLDLRLDVEAGRVVAHLADGSVVAYTESESGWSAVGVPNIRLWRDGAAPPDDAEEPDERGWVLQTDVMRRFLFAADGAVTGWRVGVAAVAVGRDEAGRIASLAETVTGRSLSVRWGDDGQVAGLASDDGRTVEYRRDAAGVLQGAVSDAGSVRYVWDGPLLVSVVDPDDVALFVNVYDDGNRVVQQTSPHGRVSTYTYEDTGMTVFSDAAGVVQGMRHDALGNLTAVFDVDGSAMHLSYDDQRRVVRVTERDGATKRYRYDGDDLVEVVDPDGLSRRWSWDDRHRLVEEIDRTGAVTRYEYDTDHMAPSRVIGPDGAVTAQVLDARGLPVEIVDADGVVSRLRYDTDGQLAAVADAFGEETAFDYNTHGHLVRITPPSGAPTVMEIDGGGRVVRTERGDAVWEYSYTPAGRACGGVEPGGIAWTATFGDHGSLATFTDDEGSTVEFAYDAIGNVTETTAPDGAVYRNVYDEVGKLVAAIEPTGATSAKGYDRRGRLIEVTEPNGGVWKRRLDVLGRTIASVAPDGGETTWTYHPNGEIKSVITPDGRAWRTEIDVNGRPVAQIDPTGGRATIDYTPAGRVAARTSPAGRTERFDYDAAGRLSAVVGFDGVRRTIGRDARGWIASVESVDPNAEPGRATATTEYRWDDDYRLVAVTTRDAEHGERHSSFRRDAGGRVTEAVDATGVTSSYTWDSRGLLASATDPAGGATSYDYDVRGRLASQVTPGGGTTTFGYGPDGRPESITDPAGVVSRTLRDANGRTIGMRHGDGSGWDRRLDEMGREVERTATDGTVAGRYSYDAVGRLAAATAPDSDVTIEFLWDDNDRIETVHGPDGPRRVERDADGWVTATVDPDGVRTEFERDPQGRIVGARTDDAGPAGGSGIEELDGVERTIAPTDRDRAGRLTIGRDGTVYRYDDAGRLAEVAPTDGAPTTYTYSDNGLLAAEHGPNGRRAYRYDVAGRVIAVDDDAGTTTIDYDACGRRSTETDPSGHTTRYRWDDLGRLVGIDRYDGLDHILGSVDVAYDALGRPHLVGGETVGYDPATGLADRIGDRRVAASDLTETGTDQPFGGVPVGDVWILGVRALDPSTHQFLSSDPLLPVPGRNGAASGYTYGWNDPINWIDPTGMRPLSVEEFEAHMDRAEQSKLGSAWNAITDDPWGTLAMVGVTAVGVGLLFVPGGQVIGAGILIGVGTSAGIGVATGNFSPRTVAVSGVFGAIPGGATVTGAIRVGAMAGGGETIADSLVNGRGFPSPAELAIGVGSGGLLSGAGRAIPTSSSSAPTAGISGGQATPPTSTAAANHTPAPAPAQTVRPPDSPHYSVAYEAQLPPSAYPGYSDRSHFRQANRELHEQFQADPSFAAAMDDLYPGVVDGVAPGPRGGYPGGAPTPELTWHHATEPGAMQLIPREHHIAPGPVQQSLHPGGQGGMATWGGGR